MRAIKTYPVVISCPDHWNDLDVIEALIMLEQADMRDALATVAENMLTAHPEFGTNLAVSVEDRP